MAVKENLIKRGVAIENGGLCDSCGLVLESVAHLALWCNVSWKFWYLTMVRVGIVWCIPGSFSAVLEEWPALRFKSDRILWDLIPSAVVWSIWMARNNQVFGQKEFNFDSIWDLHLMRMMWWTKASWEECPYSAHDFTQHFEKLKYKSLVRPVRNQVWCPPTANSVKFNVDGSTRGSPGVSGIGGVLTKQDREIIGMFAVATGVLWAYQAEVNAIHRALNFCKEYTTSHVYIESDYSLAVGWVNRKANRPWALLNELNAIDWLVSDVGCLGIGHIYREVNSMADYLAKLGCDRAEPLWEYWA